VGGHGVGKGGAALDRFDDARKGRSVPRLLHALVKDLQGLNDRQARLDERHELLVEEQKVFGIRAATPENRLLLLDIKDQISPGFQGLAHFGHGRGREIVGDRCPILAYGLIGEDRHAY